GAGPNRTRTGPRLNLAPDLNPISNRNPTLNPNPLVFGPLTPRLSPRATRNLVDWFRKSARPLPWRRDRDPYRIWVSAVMLQQTTVAAITPRFEQFLEKFPDVRALAAADEQDVLKVWEGLGYYGRARNLHRAARQLVAEHGGELPDDPAVWARLPGVGRYIL